MQFQPILDGSSARFHDRAAGAPQGEEFGAGLSTDPLGVAGTRIALTRNEEIFGEGEPAACAYRVLKGVVRTCRILTDGRRQIVEFFLPGEVFGLLACDAYPVSAEAVTYCEVLAMRRGRLSERATHDSLTAQKLLAMTLHHLRRTEEHMLILGRKTACERLAWFLMDMAERIPAPDRVELPMSRQDIADFLGLTIETVSRTMTQLQSEGLIELPSFRAVVLHDREALSEIAA
jgi:CRP/FNR family nitrogen fixation transcriptional regulator